MRLIENLSHTGEKPSTLPDKIKQGDISALVQLLIPSHIGGRLQLKGSFTLIMRISVRVGINGVDNRNSDELAANVDWAIEGGYGFGAGASGTGGLLIGWGSSSVDDATKSYSGIISGTMAAEGAVSAAVTAPIDEKGFLIDPYSGQVPPMIYIVRIGLTFQNKRNVPKDSNENKNNRPFISMPGRMFLRENLYFRGFSIA